MIIVLVFRHNFVRNDCRILVRSKYIRKKTGHDTKVYPNFTEKKFSMPNQDAEPVK